MNTEKFIENNTFVCDRSFRFDYEKKVVILEKDVREFLISQLEEQKNEIDKLSKDFYFKLLALKSKNIKGDRIMTFKDYNEFTYLFTDKINSLDEEITKLKESK